MESRVGTSPPRRSSWAAIVVPPARMASASRPIWSTGFMRFRSNTSTTGMTTAARMRLPIHHRVTTAPFPLPPSGLGVGRLGHERKGAGDLVQRPVHHRDGCQVREVPSDRGDATGDTVEVAGDVAEHAAEN